jgi:hypothetical protein
VHGLHDAVRESRTAVGGSGLSEQTFLARRCILCARLVVAEVSEWRPLRLRSVGGAPPALLVSRCLIIWMPDQAVAMPRWRVNAQVKSFVAFRGIDA